MVAGTDKGDAALRLRLAPRPTQASLLRAHLRLWLTEQRLAEDEVLDILVAANEAFGHALSKSRHPRSIAVHVDARVEEGTAELVIRDHARWEEAQGNDGGAPLGFQLMNALVDSVDLHVTRAGTVVRLRRILRPPNGARTEPAPAGRVALLRRSPIFAPLSEATLEWLDARLIPFVAAADETIISEGDQGDLFYLVANGRLDVSVESAHVATLEAGAEVGEIALLRKLPRTATVVAGEETVELYALTREDFLTAVGESAASKRAAEEIVENRLAGLQAVLGRALA